MLISNEPDDPDPEKNPVIEGALVELRTAVRKFVGVYDAEMERIDASGRSWSLFVSDEEINLTMDSVNEYNDRLN